MPDAGYEGPSPLAGERLFEDIVGARTGVTFAATDNYADSWDRVRGGRIRLAIPELFAALVRLSYESPTRDVDYPFVLSAGERRSASTNTIIRNPAVHKKARSAALRMSSTDAEALGVEAGERVRVTTRAGSCEVAVDVSDTMQAGHVSLPNGFGLDYAPEGDASETFGVAPNELTRAEDRDPIAGTPWHKYVPARIERLT